MKYYLPAILWAAVIFILTMMPGKYVAPVNIWDIANFDKLAHIAVFIALILLLMYGMLKHLGYCALHATQFAISTAICVGYGFLLEVLQYALTDDRYFELHDAIANAFGCIAGIALFKYFLQKRLIKRARQ